MCGRFTLSKGPDAITRHFAVAAPAGTPAPRYNIAPSQPVLAVRLAGAAGARELVPLQWGLVPRWSRDAASGPRPINARAETLSARPAFREAFQQRRCLIAADGFYEWQAAAGGGREQPWYIHRHDDELFAFGGLWERWTHPVSGDALESCTIVTTAPNPLLARLHDRMPLILPPEAYEAWLSPQGPPPNELLRPFPADELRMHPVGTRVGRPDYDCPDCRAPIALAAGAPAEASLFPH